jgi:hypothetical protein
MKTKLYTEAMLWDSGGQTVDGADGGLHLCSDGAGLPVEADGHDGDIVLADRRKGGREGGRELSDRKGEGAERGGVLGRVEKRESIRPRVLNQPSPRANVQKT